MRSTKSQLPGSAQVFLKVGSVALILSSGVIACGMGEDVTDQCQMERKGLETAMTAQDSLMKEHERESPMYRAAEERVRTARAALQQCEDEVAAE